MKSFFSGKTLAILRMECFATNPDGEFVNDGGFVPFVDSLAPYFGRVEVVAPIVERLEPSGGLRTFNSPNVVFRGLPDLKGLARAWWRSRSAIREVRAWSSGWDLVNLRAPDNLLPFTAPALIDLDIPFYVQLVSHPFDARDSAVGELALALRPLGRLAWNVQQRAIRTALNGRFCIAHGESLATMAAKLGADVLNLPSGSLSRTSVRPTHREGVPRKLLFVGRLNAEKGLVFLIDALAALKDLDLELTLVGWPTGDFGRRLKRHAESRGVLQGVHFHGPVAHGSDLFSLYGSHDLFVLPSVSEGTPRVVGEAMAFGLPVVTTTAGGLPDLVEDGVTGLTVPPGDVQSLAHAIRRLIVGEGLRKDLVRQASATVDGRTLEAKAEVHVAALAERFTASLKPAFVGEGQ